MPEASPNSVGWKKLFDKFPIKEKLRSAGIFTLSAGQIKKYGEREPRLMTKFDSRKHRPKLLIENNITILPVTNGEYVLLRGDGYFAIPKIEDVETYDSGKIATLQTLPWRSGIRGESQAIDTMFMASMLRTFTGDHDLQLTMRGRLGSQRFSFDFQTEVKKETIIVDGVQIEVDSGFEGESVVVLEAKFGTIDSFIIRQLYYPFRDLRQLGVTKPITPVLMIYSNKVFSLYSFVFRESGFYNSIELQRQAHYSLDETKPLPTLADLLTRRKRKAPEGVPFPQADDISKVIDLAELLTEGPSKKDQIAERFAVDPRQGDYYGNAAVWVGLAEKSGQEFRLSREGKAFVPMNRTDRIVWLSQRLCELPVFREAAAELAQRTPIDNINVVELIERVARLSKDTLERRAITVRAWLNWMQDQLAP
jgi:hypothetical protein